MKLKLPLLNFLLFLIFAVSPVADAVTGYLVEVKGYPQAFLGSPSQLVRFFILITAFLSLKRTNHLLLVAGLFLYIFVIECYSYFLHSNLSGFVTSLVFSHKILYVFVLTFVFLERMEIYREINHQNLLRFFLNSATFYASVVVAGKLFGFGISTYNDGTFGTKGLFASGNGLGIFLGSSILYAIYFKHRFGKSLFWRLQLLILFTGTLLIGSKTCFIMCLLGLVTYFLISSIWQKFLIIIISLFTGLFYMPEIIHVVTSVFDVIVYNFKNSPSLLNYVLSARDMFFVEAFQHVSYEGFLFFRFIFGAGVFLSFRNPGEPDIAYRTLENDAMDIFFSYGLIGLALYLFVISKGVLNLLNKRDYFLLFVFLLVAAHSLVAGHILFNGLSVISLIISLVMIYTEGHQTHENE